MVPRSRPCSREVREGRRRKAIQFADAAETVGDLADEAAAVADAYVTLLVHAGIAAADVICCARLGRHAQGESHVEAVELLRTADHTAARHLDTLLKIKTRAGYSHRSATAEDRRRAMRAADVLLAAAGTA